MRAAASGKDVLSVNFHRTLVENATGASPGGPGARSTTVDAVDAKKTGKLLRRPTEQVVQQNGPGDADIQRVHARVLYRGADLH